MEDKKILRIVRNAMEGDTESFSKLMQLKSRNILYMAISVIHDKDLSQDVAQEAALIMQRSITALKNPRAFDSWMYRIVYNACLKEVKKVKQAQTDIELDSQTEGLFTEGRAEFLPEEYVSNEEKRNELLHAFENLPEKYRMCVFLFYYEDMNYKDIAGVLDITAEEVSYRLRMAKKRLRQELLNGAPLETFPEANVKAPATLAAVPVLSQVLRMDEQGVVTVSMIDKFVASVVASTTATSAAATVTTTAGVTIPLIAKMLSSAAVPIITMATAVFAAASVAVGVYSVNTVGVPDVLPWEATQTTIETTLVYKGNPHVVFVGADGSDSPYGVSSISFVDDATVPTNITWTISTAEGETVLVAGEGAFIDGASGLAGLAPGEYRVNYFATDDQGAPAYTHRNFTIDETVARVEKEQPGEKAGS